MQKTHERPHPERETEMHRVARTNPQKRHVSIAQRAVVIRRHHRAKVLCRSASHAEFRRGHVHRSTTQQKQLGRRIPILRNAQQFVDDVKNRAVAAVHANQIGALADLCQCRTNIVYVIRHDAPHAFCLGTVEHACQGSPPSARLRIAQQHHVLARFFDHVALPYKKARPERTPFWIPFKPPR